MKKFEIREYSENFLEQCEAVDQFQSILLNDIIVALRNKIGKNMNLLSNEYYNRKMNEKYASINQYFEDQLILNPNESYEEEIMQLMQKYEEELKEERRKNSEDMVLCEAVLSNIDVVDVIVDEFMNQLLDLKVKSVDGIATKKAIQNIRLVNGFIPNKGAEIYFKSFASYSGSYNIVVNNIIECAKKKVKQNLAKEYDNADIVEVESEDEADNNASMDRLLALELEKKNLLERLAEVESEIQDAKANCVANIIHEEKKAQKIK